SYRGPSGEVGCYVAPRPLTRDSNYFEVSIVDSGVRGTIAVGLVPHCHSLEHPPGWGPGSVAYHADDGKLYSGRAKGRQFGSKCSSGDRIGCGVERGSFGAPPAQVFFTKNGQRVGGLGVPLSPPGLFPAVGLHSLGEEVRLHLPPPGPPEDEGGAMLVDSLEEEWGRLHDPISLSFLGCTPMGGAPLTTPGAPPIRGSTPCCPLSSSSPSNPFLPLFFGGRTPTGGVWGPWGGSPLIRGVPPDDGKLFHGSGVGDPFGPRCYKGDVMGCGIMFPRDYGRDSEG
ncbi:SPRY3 protein, partial [Locustella ochotensis]|nr:SPRY3 protein [Locustella ochotensis]